MHHFSPDLPFSSSLPHLTCPFCHFPHCPFFLAYLLSAHWFDGSAKSTKPEPPWKIAAVWVQLLLSYLLPVDKFLIKHYQLNSRHKKDMIVVSLGFTNHLFQSPCIGCRTTTFNSWSARLSLTISYQVLLTEQTWNYQTASEVLLCGLFLFCELSDNRNYNSLESVCKLRACIFCGYTIYAGKYGTTMNIFHDNILLLHISL